MTNYAQMPGKSIIVTVNGEEHQINFALSDWSCYPYGTWIYAEINEQLGAGKSPGVDHIPVNLSNVVFTLSELPGEIQEIIAGIKHRETQEDQYTEIGRYAVQDGSVAIPVEYHDLIRFFDITHYSVWLKALGGQNGQGCQDNAWLDLSGTLSDGQRISLRTKISFGSPSSQNDSSPPTSVPVPTWYIRNNDTGEEFTTISAALADTDTLSGHTIEINAIVHTESNIVVNKGVTIRGQGSGATIIQAHTTPGAATTYVFNIAIGQTVQLQDMTIRHGRTGILNNSSASLTLTNCIISNNHAYSGGTWGGVGGIDNNSILTLINSTISMNTGGDGTGWGGLGGIDNSGPLTLINSKITGNTGGKGGSYGGHGGIHTIAIVKLTNSEISGNTGGYGSSFGGTGGFDGTNSMVTLTNTFITGNTGGASGRFGGVGGMYMVGGSVLGDISASYIFGNTGGVGGSINGVDDRKGF